MKNTMELSRSFLARFVSHPGQWDVKAWNEWRSENPQSMPDLSGLDFSGMNLAGANLSEALLKKATLVHANLGEANLADANCQYADLYGANLVGANLEAAWLTGANLVGANLNEADLTGADLAEAILAGASLSGACLVGAELGGANLTGTDLKGANLTGASLWMAILVRTTLFGARLDDCTIYGASVWDVALDEATSQRGLVISPPGKDTITVESLEIGQFINTLLENERIRRLIDTITSKVVLVLGRFREDRKTVLDVLRTALRKRDYTPVVFDFDEPESRDRTETISTLAHMARFVIADITDAKSIPQELQKIVPSLPSAPVRPIILGNQYEYALFQDFGGYLSMLAPFRYQDTAHLLEALDEHVIEPALSRAERIAEQREMFEQELREK